MEAMFVLGPHSRLVLAGAAFASFAASFVATPLVARSAADLPAHSPLPATPSPAVSSRVPIVPRRDPFAGDVPATSPLASPPSAALALPAIPATLRPLPPNAGAPPLPFEIVVQQTRVTAVVTGTHPFALVDEAGSTRIVTLRDRLAGETIVAITSRGVQLERGRLLAVDPASSAQPASETVDR
jgi:hypothetical protein